MTRKLLLVLGLSFHAAAHGAVDYDVVVYGSTPAGIAAATAAGHLGMRVALFEPLKMIGGMGAAGNLALNDGGVAAERTGLARNFSLLNAEYYGLKPGTEVPHPESFVSNSTFYKMLGDAGVRTVKLDCRLLSAKATHGTPSKIAQIEVFCERQPISATVFVDASYDGDIMVMAGNIDYTSGREAMSTYQESYGGARKPGFVGVGGPKHVNALDDDGNIIKYVANISQLAPPESADGALMAFQHRMCISGDPDRVPWPKPEGYDPKDFLLIQRSLTAGGIAFNWSPLPGYPGTKKKCLIRPILVY